MTSQKNNLLRVASGGGKKKMPPSSVSRRERERNQGVLSHGAEAKIILSNNIRRDSNLKGGLIKGNLVPFIIKDRIKKSYRIPEIDEKIRKQRTKAETKLLIKASQIINAPIPKDSKEKNKIFMPFINGKKLSEYLDKFPLKKQKQICKQIGESVAKLHDQNIIHGDLTTSNMILKEKLIRRDPKFKGGFDKGNQVSLYLIDFGLGFISHKYEDKAVDLHLLKQALEAKHFKNWEVLFKEIIKEYKKSNDSKTVLERLKTVEKRGRYKS